MPDLTPDDVARREFRSGFRGYETSEVRTFLAEVAAGLAALVEDRDALVARLESGDLKSEIQAVSHEVGQVLETARAAAATMRERASNDATKWRSEAIAEAEAERKRAAIDAERLRTDAWTTSEQLLSQCQVQAGKVVEAAEAESLRLLGEAEREAHRLLAASRRESEDLVRAARMEAERVAAESRARHDEMIAKALEQSEAAQQRTLALEQRRQELLRELEMVRATLIQVEGEIDQRRERLGLSASEETIGKVVTAETPPPARPETAPSPSRSKPAADGGTWEPGETVRVVRPERPGEAPTVAEVAPQSLEPEVRILSGRQFAAIKAGLEPEEVGEAPTKPVEPPTAQVRSLAEDATVKVVRPEAAGDSIEPEASGEAPAQPVDEPPTQAVEPEVGAPVVQEPASQPEPMVVEVDEASAAVEREPESEPESEPEPEPLATPEPEPDVMNLPEPVRRQIPYRPIDQPVPEPSYPARLQSAPRIVSVSASSEAPTPGSGVEDDQPRLFSDVAGLFDRLRVPGDGSAAVDRPGSEPPSEPAVDPVMERRLTPSIVEPFEVRDRLLLPVGNRALRNLKRQLTEAQNEALEEIRLDETGWQPSVEAIGARVRADLVVLYAESFGAGHAAAEEMMGGRVSRPATPRDQVASDFVDDLVRELSLVLTEGRHAGHGARQLGASLSRVFRGWRTDQAERRVRDLSLRAYHEGLSRSLELTDVTDLTWRVAGRGCATCRGAGEERPAGALPPAHPGCECTLAP